MLSARWDYYRPSLILGDSNIDFNNLNILPIRISKSLRTFGIENKLYSIKHDLIAFKAEKKFLVFM